jgi:uncharacterized membrane protein
VARYRHSNEEIKARLVFIVGIGLTVAFVGTIFTLLYGLLFVVQPVGEIAPNDQSAWEILKPMTLFITGGLSGMLASNGLKDPKEPKP